MSARLHFGTSGWNTKDWIGPFYPAGTKPHDMLAHYCRVFSSVEVDASYYGIPRASSIEAWRTRSADNFRLSLKTPSTVTHERRFVNTDAYFSAFLERVRPLGNKLGAILIQCPPDFAPARESREALFSFLETELRADFAFALELRDPRWYDDALFAHARANGFTLAVTEGTHSDLALAARIVDELVHDPPAPHAYIRWLGEQTLPHYDRVQLDRSGSHDAWERMIRSLQTVCTDIYAYASNDFEGFAPATVRAMLARLGEPLPPETGELKLL
ncbi:MAG TPA: DUF72 domain-containing protein [Candidatus Eremiobacteraceae bacterium]|nr:DUF72 domain-containing protein [Candidatus Eremiobacteraceae bacterium]